MATAPPAALHPDLIHQVQLAFTGDRTVLAGLVSGAGALAVNLVIAGLILWFTIWLSGRLSRVAREGIGKLNRHHPADPTLQAFVGSLVRYIVVIIGLIAVLQQLGVKATSVIAVLGAASLAIGLALQGALSNVAAGVMILLLRPYRVGDQVMINNVLGKVKGLDLFSTRLANLDDLDVFVPNGKVFGEIVINYTSSGRRRFELMVGVDYDDDLDLALQTMLEIADADPRILKDPKPWAKVIALADSSVTLQLRAHTKATDWNDTRYDTLKAIKHAFEARGLSFPYPQQTVSERSPAKPADNDPDQPADPRLAYLNKRSLSS